MPEGNLTLIRLQEKYQGRPTLDSKDSVSRGLKSFWKKATKTLSASLPQAVLMTRGTVYGDLPHARPLGTGHVTPSALVPPLTPRRRKGSEPEVKAIITKRLITCRCRGARQGPPRLWAQLCPSPACAPHPCTSCRGKSPHNLGEERVPTFDKPISLCA